MQSQAGPYECFFTLSLSDHTGTRVSPCPFCLHAFGSDFDDKDPNAVSRSGSRGPASCVICLPQYCEGQLELLRIHVVQWLEAWAPFVRRHT